MFYEENKEKIKEMKSKIEEVIKVLKYLNELPYSELERALIPIFPLINQIPPEMLKIKEKLKANIPRELWGVY